MPRNSDGTVTLKTKGKTGRKGGTASGIRKGPMALSTPVSAKVVKTMPKGKAVKDSDRT